MVLGGNEKFKLVTTERQGQYILVGTYTFCILCTISILYTSACITW